jgi:hypothetical protein
MPRYYEIFFHEHNDKEFHSTGSPYPFPLLNEGEEVEIDGTRYMVLRREQERWSHEEVIVNYFVTPVK